MDNKNNGKGKIVEEDDDETMVIDPKELKPTFTCAICINIIRQTTALTGCLHRFCWRCISGKIIDHDWRCCPVCYADLGSNALEKLRFDHRFDTLRRLIFPQGFKHLETESETSEASSSSSSNTSGATSSFYDSSEAPKQEDTKDVNPSVHAKKRYKVTKE